MAVSVTFVNHATLLLQFDGCSLLTDPVYSFSVSFFLPRLKRPGIPFDRLPRIDHVLISHDHYDHLNLRTLRKIRRAFDPTAVVPRGLGKYARRTGFSTIVELDWWEEFRKGDLTITAVPAKHFSGRKGWDRNRSVFCGYVVTKDAGSVYFAGDTGYDEQQFRKIGSRHPIDIALLPIGAYKPHAWFREIHLNPQTAIRAFLDLQAKHLIPIHWGTFKISDEPMAEPPQWLRQEAEKTGISDRVHILNNGESFRL